MRDQPVAPGVEHRVVRRAAGRRRSWRRGPPTWVARASPSGAHHPDVRPGDRQDAAPTPRRRADRADAGLRAGRGCSGWLGRNGARCARTATGPTPGPPPPCGMQNVLCRFRWRHVGAEPARPGQPDQRVEVRAVDVHLAAGVVHRGAELGDAVLEHAVRRRVGDHDRGQPVARAASILASQVVEVDVAVVVGSATTTTRMPAITALAALVPCARRRDQADVALRRRRGRGGRRGWPAARRARPGSRRWAAATTAS